MTVSVICWALWLYDRQSDMLGFVGHMTVSLICWVLWSCDRQCDFKDVLYIRVCVNIAVLILITEMGRRSPELKKSKRAQQKVKRKLDYSKAKCPQDSHSPYDMEHNWGREETDVLECASAAEGPYALGVDMFLK